MNLQDQVRIREKIMRLQEAMTSLVTENAAIKSDLDLLKKEQESLKALLGKRPVGRPRKNG